MTLKELENKLAAEGENYRNMEMPEELKWKLKQAAVRARRTRRLRKAGAAAAAVLFLVLLPNTGENMAYAMGNLPVVGRLFRAVTFMNYQYEGDRFNADVDVPQIVIKDGEGDRQGNTAELDETVKQVNFDIEETISRLVAEFQASAELGESYGELEVRHETVTDDDRYFSLKLFIYQGAGSGTQSYKIYTIDKVSGQQVRLGDLFQEGSGYSELISENLREQMRSAMAEDSEKTYWVDKEDIPGLNWKGLEEDADFYFDQMGNLVIAFDEYEVAPGYMGAQEFTVAKSVYEHLLR